MNGPEHYRNAEALLVKLDGAPVAIGQVLAQAAAVHAHLADVALRADIALGRFQKFSSDARADWVAVIR